MRFLNQFARVAENKLRAVGESIGRVEKKLVLLEEKLARVPGIADDGGVGPAHASAPTSESAGMNALPVDVNAGVGVSSSTAAGVIAPAVAESQGPTLS